MAGLVWLMMALPAPVVQADSDGLTRLDPYASALLASYPQKMANNAYTFYLNSIGNYQGMTRDEIVERTGPTHGESYLILGLHRMMADKPEGEVWDDIRKAREHGSLDAMVMFGHAFENGAAGYRRDLDHAEKNFRRAAEPKWKHTGGAGGRNLKTPNHGNRFQLVGFLRRHPDRQKHAEEAEMAEEDASRLHIGAYNLRVKNASGLGGPVNRREANRIVEHLLNSDEEGIAKIRLEIANYFMNDQFKNGETNALRLRESVFREFPEEYGRDPDLNQVLITHYRNGLGTEKNMERAFFHIRILAETGDIDATTDLASAILNNAHGFERDGRAIIAMLTPLMTPQSGASDTQRATAAVMIGNVYDHAIDVEFDFPAAYNWYRLAFDFGRERGLDAFIDETHGKMTLQERAEYEQAYQAFRHELGLGRTDH